MSPSYPVEGPITGAQIEKELKDPRSLLSKVMAAEEELAYERKDYLKQVQVFLNQQYVQELLDRVVAELKAETHERERQKLQYEKYQESLHTQQVKAEKEEQAHYDQRYDKLINHLVFDITNLQKEYVAVVGKEYQQLVDTWKDTEKNQAEAIVNELAKPRMIEFPMNFDINIQLSAKESAELTRRLESHATPQKIRDVVGIALESTQLGEQGSMVREIDVFDTFKQHLQATHTELISKMQSAGHGLIKLTNLCLNNPELKKKFHHWREEIERQANSFEANAQKAVEFFAGKKDKIDQISSGLAQLHGHEVKSHGMFNELSSHVKQLLEGHLAPPKPKPSSGKKAWPPTPSPF